MVDTFKKSSSMTVTWFALAAIFIGACTCKVQITSFHVPPIIQEGELQSVVLDCQYNLSRTEGLVVQWYYGPTERHMKRVYQWIYGQRPLAFGAFKNSVNLAYKASSDPHTQHRAMNILHPTRNMSGTYWCAVETYHDGTDQAQGNMLVFVPQATLQLSQDRIDEDSVRVSCTADDVYPTPVMSIRVGNRILSDVDTNVTQSVDLLYDIRVDAELDTDELPEDPTDVACELTIPQANYTVRQEALIYKAALATTAPKSAASADLAMAASRNNRTYGLNSSASLLPSLHLLLAVFLYRLGLML